MSWLKKACRNLKTHLLPPELIEVEVINWCLDSMEGIQPDMIRKAFEVTAISKPVHELRDEQKLATRLFAIVDDYLFQMDNFPNDDENGATDDKKMKELRDIHEDQELYIENS